MSSSPSPQIVVVGAGIAGLATAAALCDSGHGPIEVFETEDFPFSQASGRNAAIYRPLETDPVLCSLAAENRQLLHDLQGDARSPLLDQRGLLLLDQTVRTLDAIAHNAQRHKVAVTLLRSRKEIAHVTGLPLLHDGPGLWSPDAGVLDPHEIGQALLRRLSRGRVPVRCNDRVRELLCERGRCTGVRLNTGEIVFAEAVVVAAGAESIRFALQAGTTVPLIPIQRHLAVLEVAPGLLDANAPVVWSLSPEFYFRPEAFGVLVSPCDETPIGGSHPQAELDALSPLASRFLGLFPGLSGAKVRRYWACIRTKAVDGRPLIGPDPAIPGLHYMTGLGGFGMSCGLAAAARFAAQFSQPRALDPNTAPLRFHLPWQRSGEQAAQ